METGCAMNSEEKQKEKQLYTFSNETGDAELAVYTVFPGIQVIYNSVHMDRFDLNFKRTTGNYIEIHHCREGRIEQEYENEFFYLMPGDLSIDIRTRMAEEYNFPMRHYHGVTIAIDTDVAPKCFSAFMQDYTVQPLEVAKRLCRENSCFIFRSESRIEHIFTELYTVAEEQKLGYLKIKILELLYVLNSMNPDDNKKTELILPRTQVQLAKDVAAYLTQNMNRHINSLELSREFGVSESSLKLAFKGVYGVPMFSYMRYYKMQTAAELLVNTKLTISEIAGQLGYSNESKFSAAFRQIIGEPPAKFRSLHTKMKIL